MINDKAWLLPLARKLAFFANVGDAGFARLAGIVHRHMDVPAGTDLIRAGQPFGHIFLLYEGWAIAYRARSDGRRQIANFILPGDFMCLNATVMERADYDITTVTRARYSVFQVEDFIGLIEREPLLCAAIFWCTAREDAILLEHLVSLGRRTAFERVAHIILELWRRLQIVGLADEASFWMPLSQELIADCVGLTSVHVNRMMRAMEKQGLMACQYRPVNRCRILDARRLEEAAGFEDGYLHFTEMPRSTRAAFRHLEKS
jgi:CRP-like cAMP-binding protein